MPADEKPYACGIENYSSVISTVLESGRWTVRLVSGARKSKTKRGPDDCDPSRALLIKRFWGTEGAFMFVQSPGRSTTRRFGLGNKKVFTGNGPSASMRTITCCSKISTEMSRRVCAAEEESSASLIGSAGLGASVLPGVGVGAAVGFPLSAVVAPVVVVPDVAEPSGVEPEGMEPEAAISGLETPVAVVGLSLLGGAAVGFPAEGLGLEELPAGVERASDGAEAPDEANRLLPPGCRK